VAIVAATGEDALVNAAVKDSDRAAFDAVYRTYYPGLCRLATLMCGNPSDGQDIAQEAFAKWYVRRGSVDNPEAYLRTVALNLTRGRFRKLGVSRKFAPLLEADLREQATDQPDVLADVIAKLPQRQRAAVILRFYEGRSEAEIATILHCRPGTVKSLLSRALQDMRQVIER
jgi:RNA polymerase sigma factor (sigma-70 family)